MTKQRWVELYKNSWIDANQVESFTRYPNGPQEATLLYTKSGSDRIVPVPVSEVRRLLVCEPKPEAPSLKYRCWEG